MYTFCMLENWQAVNVSVEWCAGLADELPRQSHPCGYEHWSVISLLLPPYTSTGKTSCSHGNWNLNCWHGMACMLKSWCPLVTSDDATMILFDDWVIQIRTRIEYFTIQNSHSTCYQNIVCGRAYRQYTCNMCGNGHSNFSSKTSFGMF